jgi:LysM repeat protein
MKNKFFNQCMVVILIALTAASCSKPASVATQATPTTLGDLPFPLATQPNIMNEILFGTQTAEAMAHEITGGESTPEPTMIIDLSSLETVESTPAVLDGTGATETLASGTLAATAGTGLTATVGTTKTAVTYATATPGRPTSYTVHKGEFPYCLARRFNVSAGDLLSLNGLGANTQVSEGTSLQIPTSGEWNAGDRSLKSHPTTYTVATGDTIYSIACAFGDVDPNTIIAANGLVDPYTLTSGTSLTIP